MPGGYAHFRFGQSAASALPHDGAAAAQKYRQLYDLGLQGPDLFFYHDLLHRNTVVRMGSALHAMSGKDFFAEAAQRLRRVPSEAGTAYLFGVLAHYALDSVCHPFIVAQSDAGIAEHSEIETEFDRFLLHKDGRNPPCCQNLSRHYRLRRKDVPIVARFYPDASTAILRRCSRNMVAVTHVLTLRNRKLVESVFQIGGKQGISMVMHQAPNPRCAHLNEQLLKHYTQALMRYPQLAEQLSALLRSNTPLGEEFAPNFG